MLAEDGSHLGDAVGLVAADAGEGFLVLDELREGGVGITHTHQLIHRRGLNAHVLHGLRDLELMADELQCIDGGLVDFKDFVGFGGVNGCSAVAALTDLGPRREIEGTHRLVGGEGDFAFDDLIGGVVAEDGLADPVVVLVVLVDVAVFPVHVLVVIE